MPREKSRYRDRRSSSRSSVDSYDKKKSRNKHRRRSKSRGRSESDRRMRSTSRTRHRRRSHSRSSSRDRYDSKSRRKKSSRRSVSQESRSSSNRAKHSKTRHRSRRKSRSTSRSSSYEIERPIVRTQDDTERKVERAIKAAEAAGVTLTKIPTFEYKAVQVKEDMPTIHDRNILDELNSEAFVQKSFTSSRNKKESIVIDLDNETVKVPKAAAPKVDSIIDFSELPCEEELREMWVKKLYQYRKKMLQY